MAGGVTPQGKGRYPGFDVLAQVKHWDAATRRVVLARLDQPPPAAAFTESQQRTLEAFCDTVLAQHAEPRVPVLARVAERLEQGPGAGFQHTDLPPALELWQLVALGLDAGARSLGAPDFAGAPTAVREQICGAFAAGELSGEPWDGVPVQLAWKVVMAAVLNAFYSHPWAWNEIGFGGPAYPRGYARLGADRREAWEADESPS